MLEMLAACIKIMQCHHKALLLGPCMDEFKRHLASLEPPQHYDYNIHNHKFRDFQKKSKVMVDSQCKYGMFGCWQPAFDLKLAFVASIKVPCFVPHSHLTIQQAKHDIWETCCKLGKRHVYEAHSDMHPSDIDGKRPAYWVNNMNGTTFMFKLMAYAHEHMLELHDIATHAESEHPHTGHRTKWQATLCDNARLPPAMTPQRQLPFNSVYVNGVALPPTTTHSEPTRTLAATSGVPTWTTSSAAKALQDRVDGSTQVALNEKCICLHTTKYWQDTINTWVEPEDVAEITRLPLPQLLGGTLFANQVDRAKRDIMAMLSSSLATGVLPPDYKLMQAKTSFAMYSHLTPGD